MDPSWLVIVCLLKHCQGKANKGKPNQGKASESCATKTSRADATSFATLNNAKQQQLLVQARAILVASAPTAEAAARTTGCSAATAHRLGTRSRLREHEFSNQQSTADFLDCVSHMFTVSALFFVC